MRVHDAIPRELPVRPLSAPEIRAITRTVFVPSHPRRSDVLVVFGAPAASGRWAPAAELLHQGFAPRVVATGGARYRDGCDLPEAQGIRDALVAAGIPAASILVEDRSANTLENVLFTIELLDAMGPRPASLLFYCKSHHSGRVWRTLRRHLPGVALSCATYDAVYGAATVCAATWMHSEPAIRRVLAEHERIRVYAGRGDIAP